MVDRFTLRDTRAKRPTPYEEALVVLTTVQHQQKIKLHLLLTLGTLVVAE